VTIQTCVGQKSPCAIFPSAAPRVRASVVCSRSCTEATGLCT
jgi:hypothetical protein